MRIIFNICILLTISVQIAPVYSHQLIPYSHFKSRFILGKIEVKSLSFVVILSFLGEKNCLRVLSIV